MSKKKDEKLGESGMIEENESLKYEKMYLRLQQIVEGISAKESSNLDEVVSSIEEGYKLIEAMRKRLEQAKDKVDMIRKLNVCDSDTETEDGETPF